MKTRAFYLALAVAAAAIAPSCVEEQIEPQEKPEVEIVGQVFEASHEVLTKSTLIDLVPTWVEGDKILVSGADEEAECTFFADNKFQTGDEDVRLASPYYAIYPAAVGNTVDRETGIFTAAVPSVQEIPATQNVAPGALVAVASSETTNLPFKNAVGLVKVNIGRNDIVSVLIESTNAEQKIAGKFTMDLDPDKNAEDEAPEIEMTEGVASVELKPAEGTFAAGTYYATVLPCAIDGVKVTFTRLNGETEEAVTVQKATATTIARNSGIDLGDFFLYEIGTAQELLAWNKAAAKWTAWDVVRLTADIDCADVITSDNWTPNTFTGVFDGNEKTINNFVITKAGPAAFFGEVNEGGAVKNLTFGAGCSVTSTGSAPSGSVYVTGRVYAASLVCELEGSATLANIVNYGAVNATSEGVANKGNYIGGVCASSTSSGALSGCVNHGPVTYTAVPVVWSCVGGVFGQVTGENSVVSACHNYGTVLFNGDNNGGKSINLAGIAGGAYYASFSTCSNLGKIWSNTTAAAAGKTNIGGIVGHNNNKSLASVQYCSNGSSEDSTQGELINSGPTSGEVRLGGCVAFIQSVNTSVSDFKNYGPITNSGQISNNLALGGVVGEMASTTEATSVSNCENHGKISTTVYNATANKYNSLGGIIGCATKCADNTIIDVKNEGALTSTSTSSSFKAFLEIGGIVGFVNAGKMTVGDETVDGVQNAGAILANRCADCGLGGIVGKIYGANVTITNAKNSNNVQQSSWQNDPQYGNGIGGILGFAYSDETAGNVSVSVASCSNSGSVDKVGTGSGTVDKLHLGGIVGHLADGYLTGNVSNSTNSGDVTFLSDGNTYVNAKVATYTGGVVGFFGCEGSVAWCVNNGIVKSNICSKTANSSYPYSNIAVGGIIGFSCNGALANCINNGDVLDNSKSRGGYVGGIVGCINQRATTLENCDNHGAVSGKFDSESMTSPQNRSNVFLGGVVGGSANLTLNMTGCDNSGAVTNYCTTNANSAKTAMGGLVGLCYANTITDCHVTGNVTNSCPDKGNEHLAGFIGQIESNVVSNISNSSVNSTVSPKLTTTSGMFVGRFTDKSSDGITTTLSNIYVKGTFNGTELTADDYTSYCYGTGSDYKVTTNISYGAYVAPAE